MQSAVGGLIQILTPFEDPAIILVCNDEGKLMGFPLNRGLRHPERGELYDVISGTFFLNGDSDGELFSLTEEQIKNTQNATTSLNCSLLWMVPIVVCLWNCPIMKTDL